MGVGVNGCIAIAPTPLASRLLTTSAEQLSAGDRERPTSPFARDNASREDLAAADKSPKPSPVGVIMYPPTHTAYAPRERMALYTYHTVLLLNCNLGPTGERQR